MHGIFDSNPLALVPGPCGTPGWEILLRASAQPTRSIPSTVLRGGFGFFYDLGYGDIGLAAFGFPYYRSEFPPVAPGTPFDLSNPFSSLRPFSTAIDSAWNEISAVDPNLRVPFTQQWNAAVERQLGAKETLSATYVGSFGMRLLREDRLYPPAVLSLGAGSVYTTWNAGNSTYNAFQLQFQRRMSHGLQALVSYNFGQSSDWVPPIQEVSARPM